MSLPLPSPADVTAPSPTIPSNQRHTSTKHRQPTKKQFATPCILLFNARSLSNKVDDLIIRTQSRPSDIIVITETWLDNHTSDSAIHIPGYSVIRQDRDANGGGVAIFYKSDLQVVLKNDMKIQGIKTNILSCTFPDFDTTLFAIYHPYWGSSAKHDLVISHLQIGLDISNSQHNIITGDINDLRLSIDSFFNYNGLTQVVLSPTRGNNVLDIFATSCPEKYQKPEFLAPLGRSDHKGIYLKPKTARCTITTKIKVRSFTPSSFASCMDTLSCFDWSQVFALRDNIDDMVATFESVLKDIYHKFFPEKTVRMRNTDPPWITPCLKTLSDARDRALHRGNYAKFICLRERFIRECNKAKTKYFQRFSSTSMKKRWTAIKQQIGNKTSSPLITNSKAEELNDLFFKVFSPSDIHLFQTDQVSAQYDDVSVPAVSEYQVVNLMRKCKSNASGPDGIPGYFYRFFAEPLAVPLSLIFNCCLHSATFPMSWKRANILPKHKSSTEYRPISILSFPSKILERLTRDLLLMPALNHPINPNQFGFVSNGFGGCTNALLTMRLHIIQHLALSPQNYVRIAAIDFRKAFDSISHSTLLESLLQNFKCNSHAINIIHSFLSNRVQRVITNHHHTAWQRITSGVPQGSILGPTLFALLIDDLHPFFTNSQIIAYADDVTVLHLLKEGDTDNLQPEINQLVVWSTKKKLSINTEKTKTLTVSRSRTPPSSQHLIIEGVQIEDVSVLKILGIYLQANGSWDMHMTNTLKKYCRAVSLIKRLRIRGCSSDLMWQAYQGLAFCHLTYCWPVLCDVAKKHFNKFVRIDRVVRRWCNAEEKRTMCDALDSICVKLILKILRNKESHPLVQFFTIRNTSSSLRHQRALNPSLKTKSAFYNNSFLKFSSFS